MSDSSSATGITALDIAELPDSLRGLMNAVLRLASAEGVNAQTLQVTLPDVKNIADCLTTLLQRGFLRATQTDDGPVYHANLRRKPGARGINWDKLAGDG